MLTSLLALIPDPAPLPTGPLWERWLLESPWPTAGLLVLAGLVAFALLNRAGRAGAAIASALTALALGAGVIVLANIVTTEREALRARSFSIVAAVAARDQALVGTLLAPNARLTKWPLALTGRDAIVERVGSVPAIHEWALLEAQASLDGPAVGRTQIKLRITPDQTRAPNLSWWRLDWQRDAQGQWVVIQIEPLAVHGITNIGP
ncbi:MAG: hypothetical protein SFY95_01490 [Planctomycetota bacterium]|nr:hypothetical protein [Planctomycetota bacterium]